MINELENYGVFRLKNLDPTKALKEVDNIIENDKQTNSLRITGNSIRPRNLLNSSYFRNIITDSDILNSAYQFFDQFPTLCSLGTNIVMPCPTGLGPHRDYPYFADKDELTISG